MKDTPRRQTRASSRIQEKEVEKEEKIEEETLLEEQENEVVKKKTKSTKKKVNEDAVNEESPVKKNKNSRKLKEKSTEKTSEINEDDLLETETNIEESPVKKSKKSRKLKEKSTEKESEITEDNVSEMEEPLPESDSVITKDNPNHQEQKRTTKKGKRKIEEKTQPIDLDEGNSQDEIIEEPVRKSKKSSKKAKVQPQEITDTEKQKESEINEESKLLPQEEAGISLDIAANDSDDEAPEGISLKDSRLKAKQIQHDISEAKKLKKSQKKQAVQEWQLKNQQQQEKKKSQIIPDIISEDVLKLVQENDEQSSDSDMDIDAVLNQIGQDKPTFKTQPKNKKITFDDDEDDDGFDEQFLDADEDDLESDLPGTITAQHLYSIDKTKDIGTNARQFLQQHFFGNRLKREMKIKSNFNQSAGSKKSKQIGKRKKVL